MALENAVIKAKQEKEAKITRKEIYKGKIISLVADSIVHEQGSSEKVFDIVVHPGAVVIIPIDEQGNLILVKQWRRAANKILIELPAGTLEKEEEPIVCAMRELQEEIGYKADEILPFGGFFTAPGFCTEYLYLFIARNLKLSQLIGEDTDEIDSLVVSLDKALEMIEKEEIVDAKTIAGIYRYEKWQKQNS